MASRPRRSRVAASRSAGLAQAPPARLEDDPMLPTESVRGLPEQPAPSALAVPTGVFQVVEKMKKRRCALCPQKLECSVLYFAEKENIVAHENCLLYSSGLVECEAHAPFNHDRNFDVESVKKEINRGKKLKCKGCGEKGATVGCDVKACNENYHYFCAINNSAAPDRETYRVLCRVHKILTQTQRGDTEDQTQDLSCQKQALNHWSRIGPPGGVSGETRKAGSKKQLSTGIHVPQPKETPCPVFLKQVTEERGKDTDVNVKAAFLKKCKEAGLLNDLFEVLLEKLIFVHERLMDDTTSEEGYEEIGTSLLDCRLFEDTFVNFQAAIEDKIQQYEEKQQQLSTELELLQKLKQTPCPLQENRGSGSSSTSASSVSSLS